MAGDAAAVHAVDADVPVEGVPPARSHGRHQRRGHARSSGHRSLEIFVEFLKYD